jgi:hypothetical protein
MAGLTYPTVLVPENWNKQKGVSQKPTGVPDALAALKKAHGSIGEDLLETSKLKTVEQMQDRIDALDAELQKGVKAAADEAKNVVAQAKKAEAEFKKVKENPKEATAAAIAVGKAAGDYAKSISAAFQAALKDLAPRLAKLEAEAKKNEPEEEKEDPNIEKDRAKVGKMVDTAMKLAKTAGAAKPMRFMIGVLKKELYVFVGKATSGSTAARIKKLMEAGTQSVTIYRGECLFENKAHVFIGVNIPTGGFAVRIQKALIEQTGKKYKIKVRKPTGETDEAAGDDDAADDALEQATAQGGKEASRAGEVLARHKKLKPALDELLMPGSPMAGELRAGLDKFENSVRGKNFDDALKGLDELERRVKEAQDLANDNAKAKKDFTDRLTALMPDVKKAMAVAGGVGNEVKKRWADVQAAASEANKSTAKDAFRVARTRLAALQLKIADALSAKGADAEAESKARQTADEAIDKAAKGSAKTAAGGASPKLASEWASARNNAVEGIEALAKKIQDEYRDEADQKAQVDQAVQQLRTLAGKLSDGLDSQLSAVLTETDAAKRAALAATAKKTLTSIAQVVAGDKLMKELDGNELMPDLKVVAPLRAKLQEIGAALR